MSPMTELTEHERAEARELLGIAVKWAGSEAKALDWFATRPLPSFGNLTAADLLRAGRAEAVRRYLARISDGGFA